LKIACYPHSHPKVFWTAGKMFQPAGARRSNPNTYTAPVRQLANIRVNSTDILTLICASVCLLKRWINDTYNRTGQHCRS